MKIGILELKKEAVDSCNNIKLLDGHKGIVIIS